MVAAEVALIETITVPSAGPKITPAVMVSGTAGMASTCARGAVGVIRKRAQSRVAAAAPVHL